jgi:hypothetical protein
LHFCSEWPRFHVWLFWQAHIKVLSPCNSLWLIFSPVINVRQTWENTVYLYCHFLILQFLLHEPISPWYSCEVSGEKCNTTPISRSNTVWSKWYPKRNVFTVIDIGKEFAQMLLYSEVLQKLSIIETNILMLFIVHYLQIIVYKSQNGHIQSFFIRLYNSSIDSIYLIVRVRSF